MKFMSFLNDTDGFSARDFLMVLFVVTYIVLKVTLIVLALMHPISAQAIAIVDSMDTAVMTIVGGVFAVQGVREFRSNSNGQTTEVQVGIGTAPMPNQQMMMQQGYNGYGNNYGATYPSYVNSQSPYNATVTQPIDNSMAGYTTPMANGDPPPP